MCGRKMRRKKKKRKKGRGEGKKREKKGGGSLSRGSKQICANQTASAPEQPLLPDARDLSGEKPQDSKKVEGSGESCRLGPLVFFVFLLPSPPLPFFFFTSHSSRLPFASRSAASWPGKAPMALCTPCTPSVELLNCGLLSSAP